MAWCPGGRIRLKAGVLPNDGLGDGAGGPGSARCVGENIFVSRRVGVKVMRRGAHARDVRFAVRAEQHFEGGLVRLSPFPIGMRRAEMLRAGCHPRRALGMAGGEVIRAARVVENDHAPGRRRPAKFVQ